MVLHFRKATSVFKKTFPFVLLRLGVGILLGVLTILYFGFVVGAGYMLYQSGTVSGWLAIIGLVASLLLFALGWRLVSRYVLYLVKAAHIAVIAHVIKTGDVPDNQLRYGKTQVKDHFVEASSLFALDQVLKAVIKQFNKAVVSVAGFFGAVPTLKQLIKMAGKAVALAASYIDEAIIAYVFMVDEDNNWAAAKDGVVLYAKNWKPVLGSTMLIVFGMYAAAFVLFLVLSPLAGLIGNLSTSLEVVSWVVVVGTLLTIYTGILKPWIKTVVITTFLIEQRDLVPDRETEADLANRSDRFQELVDKANENEAEKQPATV